MKSYHIGLALMVLMISGCQSEYILYLQGSPSTLLDPAQITEQIERILSEENYSKRESGHISEDFVSSWSKNIGDFHLLFGQAVLEINIYRDQERIVLIVQQYNGKSGIDEIEGSKLREKFIAIDNIDVEIRKKILYGPSLR